jgi:hypothetical protein
VVQWLIDNKEWVFSGVGVALIAGLVGLYFRSRSGGQSQYQRSGDNSTNIQIGGNGTASQRHGSSER